MKQFEPPPVLNSVRVVEFAILDEDVEFTGDTSLFFDGQRVGEVPRLALCRPLQGEEVLLFHCDEMWTVLGMSGHASIQAAKDRAERIYVGLSRCWVKSGVTEEQAIAFLEEIWKDIKCSFCGRRPDQVQRMIESDSARICDICIREFADPDGDRPHGGNDA